VELASLRGQVVLLNFWATWCVPCLTELEAFRLLHAEYAARGFTVLAVSVDQPQTVARVRSFARARGFPFPVLLDPDEATYRAYGGAVMPTSVLIDRDGLIVHRKEGYQPGDEADWTARIAALLGPDPIDAIAPGGAAAVPPHPITPDGSASALDAGDPPSPPATRPELSASSGNIHPLVSGITLSGSNFLRVNYGRETRDLPEANGWLEDWFDFRIASDRLAYQSRFRAYQFLRDLPDTRENLVRDPNHRVVKQTVSYRDEHADVRAGNFYGTLNRGLVLRMFEDRQARIDRDVNGVWASLRGGRSDATWGRGRASVFGGSTYSRFDDLYLMDAEEDQLRDTYLQGVEGEWEPRAGLTVGAQAVESFRDDRHVTLAAGNVEWVRGGTNTYLGYSALKGEDAFAYPDVFTGSALYASLSQSLGRFEWGAEYKYYHNYDVGFAEPPSLVPFHTFRLAARDMLFPNNQHEEGAQVHGAWDFEEGPRAGLNVSRVVSRPERNPAYLVHHVPLPFLDVAQTTSWEGSEGGSLITSATWNAHRGFKAGYFQDVEAVTLGALGTRLLQGPWSAQWEVEAQRRETDYRPLTAPDPLGGVGAVESSEQAWLGVVSATLGRAGAGSLTLDYEFTTAASERDAESLHDRIPGVSNGWASAQLSITMLDGHRLALWGGQRRERVICSGGSCRVEPAFEGAELTWISHF